MAVDALTHDGKSLQQHANVAHRQVAFGCTRDVHRQNHLGPHVARLLHRHGRHQAAIHILAPGNAHRRKQARYGAGCAHRLRDISPAEQDALPGREVGGQHPQGKRHVLDRPAIHRLTHIPRQRIAAQQATAQDGQGPVGQGHLVHAHGHPLQLGGGFAAGVERSNQAAGRGAGQHIGTDAVFLQHLDHAHMGEAARRPAPQREAQTGCSHGRLQRLPGLRHRHRWRHNRHLHGG